MVSSSLVRNAVGRGENLAGGQIGGEGACGPGEGVLVTGNVSVMCLDRSNAHRGSLDRIRTLLRYKIMRRKDSKI